MRRDNRTAAAVVAGLVLGTLVLYVIAIAARHGRVSWDLAYLAVFAPVAGAILLGLIVDLRAR